MSVILTSEKYAILDHEAWLLQLIMQHNGKDNVIAEHKKKMQFQELFDLRTPFLMDGQAHKVAEEMEASEANSPTGAVIRARKRKRKNEGSRAESGKREAEMGHIQEIYSALRQTPEFKVHFQYTPSTEDFRRNNSHIRYLRRRFTEITSTTLPPLDEYSGNEGLQYKMVDGEQYVLPPDVRYVCDDAVDLLEYTKGKAYDLVVLDPPWQNKYVKRRKTDHGSHHGYDMMTVEDILQLPIGSVLKEGALLIIWCTNNKSKIQEFLAGLHHWDVQFLTTWYWLKLTKEGKPVTPLKETNHSKQPYERLFIARKVKPKSESPTIPDSLVFCSVPSGLHSHKPPLNKLLEDYLPPQPQCLEVFARSLVPGWTSYGLEVLRLQHNFLFQNVK